MWAKKTCSLPQVGTLMHAIPDGQVENLPKPLCIKLFRKRKRPKERGTFQKGPKIAGLKSKRLVQDWAETTDQIFKMYQWPSYHTYVHIIHIHVHFKTGFHTA